MSEQPMGPGWWQASDGKWYPPELHPDAPARPASVAPPGWAPPEQPSAPPTPAPTWTQPTVPLASTWSVSPPTPSKRRGLVIGVGAVVAIAAFVVVVLSVGSATKKDDTTAVGSLGSDIAEATGPTITTDDGSVSLTLPEGWKGTSVESGVEGVGDEIFPNDSALAAKVQALASAFPRAFVMFGLDVGHLGASFTSNVNLLTDPTAPIDLSLEALGRGESEGVEAVGGTVVDRDIIDLGARNAYRYTISATARGAVGFVVKGTEKVWILTFSFRSLTDENIALATSSAATLIVP